MIKDHKDKIALVTGSSRGLGKYLSIELASEEITKITGQKSVVALSKKDISLIPNCSTHCFISSITFCGLLLWAPVPAWSQKVQK